MPVQNAEIAAMFDQAAELLEIEGENQFRVRAYRRAARVIEGLPQSVKSLLSGRTRPVRASRYRQGSWPAKLPKSSNRTFRAAGLVETEAARRAWRDRHSSGPWAEARQAAARQAQSEHARRSSPRRQKPDGCTRCTDLDRLSRRSSRPRCEKPVAAKRFKLSVAEAEAEALVAFLRNGGRVVVAGSYRRRRDTVGDLDVVVTAKDGAAVGDKLVSYENVAEVLAHGPTRTTVVLRSGLQVDVRAVPEESYGAALLYFTGSQAHNIALRAIAAHRGWKLNEYGLFSGRRRIAGANRGGNLQEARTGVHSSRTARRPRRDRARGGRTNCRGW